MRTSRGEFANGGDFAGDVAAGNERQRKRHAVQALADPEVEMVQRAGVNADQNFVGAGLRIGDFGVLQNFGPAVLGNEDRPHLIRPRLKAKVYVAKARALNELFEEMTRGYENKRW